MSETWDSIVIDGVQFPTLKGIQFFPEIVRGTSPMPIGITKGTYTAEFTMEVSQSEWDKLHKAIQHPSLPWRRPGGNAAQRRKRRRAAKQTK